MDMGAKFLLRFAVVLCGICAVCPTWGIVLHPDNEPNLATWIDHPPVSVVGRWDNDASCVVIAPNYIITTRHQTNSDTSVPGVMVNIAGTDYTIDSFFTHQSADLRLVKLNNANLTEYVSINFDPNEVNQVAVLGGYGVSRGAELEVHYMGQDYTYGYEWLYPSLPTPANGIGGWGTNKVTGTSSTTAGYTSELIVSQFDEPLTTEYECAIGEHDSGGGWFRQTANGWEVIGLNRGVAYSGESWFLDNGNPPAPLPEYPNGPLDNYMDAVRISPYADWIIDTIYANELQNLAVQWLRDDCGAGNNYCNGADVVDIGAVNMSDFAVLSSMWLEP